VLRPAKPLRAGKSVKCPKCGAGFVVGGDEPKAAPARAKTPSPVQKKPAANAVPVAPIRPPGDDDEDGGGTYGVTKEAENEGTGISYAPDMSVRDLRGPAMQAVVDPSNKMIVVGVLGFIGWLTFLVLVLIPLLFPTQTPEEKAKIAKDRETALSIRANSGNSLPPPEEESSFFDLFGMDVREIGDISVVLAILCLVPMVLGMIYSGVLSMGAVKIQNLESREWGVAASIMAMVPINAGGMICVLAMVLNIVLDLLFEGFFKWVVLGFFLVCYWGTNLACGIWMLTVLNKPDVIAGFEYVPE
jgi:hypothetical protein